MDALVIIFWLLILLGAVGIYLSLTWSPAVALNLRLHRHRHMAQIGDKFVATIAPTDQQPLEDGTPQGNPAPVTNVLWSTAGGAYDVQGVGNSATIRADFAGTGQTVTVTATAVDGSTVTQTKSLPDVAAPVVPVAVALNLTVAPA